MFPSVRIHHLASALTRLPARTVARALVCRQQLPKVPVKFLQRNQPEKVEFVDISLPGYDGAKCKGVSFEAAMEEMHVIDERHQVHRGVPAFAVMYGAVGLGWLGRFMMWPPVRPFMDNFYAIFARNRLKWTGRGDECTTGRCQKKTR
ncbi:uncharacterized protein At5g50100, mitochondrial-like isoform X2 [Hippocampus comes]|uniref:uncharacterized protein At5g50100, mitochondrial-like isoform X2 n=1 Tax=Hippocampus comes TaxID=109280 RepID=UPI00094E2A6C|nr:PREDICTED: uncharacterized protein At5g50100, mitochondrial-like isoform X2 [Hippocampus comes]